MTIISEKQQKLNEVKQQIIDNNICPDLAKSATQLVFGDGNVNTDMVFVGEAPGKNEDIQGLPFVGAAGKFLNELLETIGLKRKDIYITNIVKYRPPDNRDPLPKEKSEFLPFLRKQIEIIKPKLVVTLGRHSMECFLPGLKISQVHGQPQKIHGQTYLPLYHPAAALYNGGLRQTLIDDFARIPSLLDSHKTPQSSEHSQASRTDFSSFNVPKGTSPSEKINSESPGLNPDRQASLRKSSTLNEIKENY